MSSNATLPGVIRFVGIIFMGLVCLTAEAGAQSNAEKAPAEGEATAATNSENGAVPVVEAAPVVAPAPAAPLSTPECTVELCGDRVDNDLDGHVDCADQDCQIFAICVQSQAPTLVAVPMPPTPPPGPMPERSRQCKDGLDNDENGLTDCHEPLCQPLSYCRKIMYERPETPGRTPGLFFNVSIGLALPNYNKPTAETESIYGTVPFDPDMGVIMGGQVGYLFLKFLGVGVNMQRAFTFASNRSTYFVSWDNEDEYKYQGDKYYGTFGGFVKLQWPFRKVVPYVNVHAGYSATKHVWYVYDGRNTWQDIYDYEYNGYRLIGPRDERREPSNDRSRHFLFALEPGLEISVIRRLFSIGIRAWLPVVATKNFSYDNIGILTSFTFTPGWREPPVLKPEYSK